MKPSERRKSRHFATQAIYQWQMAATPLDELLAQFEDETDFTKADKAYFENLLSGVVNQAESLDAQLQPHCEREMVKHGAIELAILRLGAFELAYCIDVPYKVVINESVELGKKFAATDAYKYINGVLDKLAQQLRKTEINNHA